MLLLPCTASLPTPRLLVQYRLTCLVLAATTCFPPPGAFSLLLAGEKLSPEADGHCYNPVLQGCKRHGLGGDADLPCGQLMPWEIQKPILKQSVVFRLKGETKERDNFGCFFQHYDVSKSLSSSLNNCSLASVQVNCCRLLYYYS